MYQWMNPSVKLIGRYLLRTKDNRVRNMSQWMNPSSLMQIIISQEWVLKVFLKITDPGF
jgi:hypothetical protein